MILNKKDYEITQMTLDALLDLAPQEPGETFRPIQKISSEEGMLQVLPQVGKAKKTPPKKTNENIGNLENIESIIDLFLIGKDSKGRPEIHLSLKDDVVEGLYIRLQKKDDGGYHALFITPNYSLKHQLTAHVDLLVKKLKDKGSQIKSHEIVVGDTIPDLDLS